MKKSHDHYSLGLLRTKADTHFPSDQGYDGELKRIRESANVQIKLCQVNSDPWKIYKDG